MKQAKFALTATAVLAVIGGAVAFKSRSTGFPIYQKSTAAQCTVLNTANLFTVTTATSAKLYSYATKATPAAVCPITTQRLITVE